MTNNSNQNYNAKIMNNYPCNKQTASMIENALKTFWPDIKFKWIGEKPFKETFDNLVNINRDYNFHEIKNDKGVVEKYVVETSYTPFTKDDVKVSLSNNMLNISIGGKTENKKEDNGKKYYVRQISEETFRFNINLEGLNVIKRQISAVCKDGILEINLPVYPPRSKPVDEFEIKVN